MRDWKKTFVIVLLVLIIVSAIGICVFAVWNGITAPKDDSESQSSNSAESSEKTEATKSPETTESPNSDDYKDQSQSGVTLSKEEYEQFKQMTEILLGGQQPSESPEQSEPTQEPITEPEQVEPPKAVVIQDSDGMRRHDPRVCENAYEAMAGDAVWLGQEGSFSLMLFGNVKEVYVANNSSNYTSFSQVSISEVTNTAQPYYALSYSCEQNQRILFRVVMANGTEYFISVQKV